MNEKKQGNGCQTSLFGSQMSHVKITLKNDAIPVPVLLGQKYFFH
jgi:hypothetical protein